MTALPVLAAALLLTGCSTIPAPDWQARLTRVDASAEGSTLTAGGQGGAEACIASLYGEPTPGAVAHLEAGECSLEIGP